MQARRVLATESPVGRVHYHVFHWILAYSVEQKKQKLTIKSYRQMRDDAILTVTYAIEPAS